MSKTAHVIKIYDKIQNNYVLYFVWNTIIGIIGSNIEVYRLYATDPNKNTLHIY